MLNPSQDVSIFEHLSVVDYVPVVPGYIEESHERVGAGLEEVHRAGVVPIVLGGDHSIALPELRAAAAVHGPLALVRFDSHPVSAVGGAAFWWGFLVALISQGSIEGSVCQWSRRLLGKGIQKRAAIEKEEVCEFYI